MITNSIFADMLNAPIRRFKGRVEFYEDSTLALLCRCDDNLKSFTIERAGEGSKFFGYGICQKITIHLIDRERSIHINKTHSAEVEFGVGSDYLYPCPKFYVNEVSRDENTNEITVTAYDALHEAAKHTVAELNLPDGYTIAEFAIACGSLLGLPVAELSEAFNAYYPTGANFEGTETIRAALDAIAEATQTIYFVDWDWRLTFKKLDIDGEPVFTIDKSKYFTLKSENSRTLSTVCHATELGDNVSESLPVGGVTQYVRDNPFWDLREDIGDLVSAAVSNIGGVSITPFDCSWRGNFLLEIGDKIGLITKDDQTIHSYVLNDSMTFNGSLSQKTSWEYNENTSETASNPTSLGDALNHTSAKVDKANKRIDIVAGEVSSTQEAMSQLTLDTQSINASVTRVEQMASENLQSVNDDLATLTKKVDTSITAEDVTIAIQNELSNGVDKVVTSTGFTFNDTGLTVSKSGSEMTTQITEDGMSVYRDGDKVLTADNTGVQAENLHATTYLIVGKNSRFEDYDNNRTGCFWIGQ